jgi:hypothetical protein
LQIERCSPVLKRRACLKTQDAYILYRLCGLRNLHLYVELVKIAPK